MRASGRYTILHDGVPVGVVDLPEGRTWAGGRVDALPGLDVLRPMLSAAAAAGRDAAARFAVLPVGEDIHPIDQATAYSQALRALAANVFELQDDAGQAVPASVRVVDPCDGSGPMARVDYRPSSAGTTAQRFPHRHGDGSGDTPRP